MSIGIATARLTQMINGLSFFIPSTQFTQLASFSRKKAKASFEVFVITDFCEIETCVAVAKSEMGRARERFLPSFLSTVLIEYHLQFPSFQLSIRPALFSSSPILQFLFFEEIKSFLYVLAATQLLKWNGWMGRRRTTDKRDGREKSCLLLQRHMLLSFVERQWWGSTPKSSAYTIQYYLDVSSVRNDRSGLTECKQLWKGNDPPPEAAAVGCIDIPRARGVKNIHFVSMEGLSRECVSYVQLIQLPASISNGRYEKQLWD